MRAIIFERYAEALAHVAFRRGTIQGFADDLEAVSDAVAGNPLIGKTFGNPRISPDIKTKIIDETFSDDVSNIYFINFLKVLAKAGMMGRLPDICKEYLNIAGERYKVITVIIETPVGLSDSQVEEIKQKCVKKFNAKIVRAKVVINRDLIGGMKVTAGNIVIDGSLSRQLAEIEKLLND